MSSTSNPGRVAGIWYLFLVILGPVRLMYIPAKVFVSGNAAASASNIAVHETLMRFGIAADLACGLILVFLTLAFYRLFKDVDQHLAVLVVIFGGIMPAVIDFVGVVCDLGALRAVRGAPFLAVFEKPQLDALAMLFLNLRDYQNTAAETLWGVWLLPLAILVYKSRLLPRFIGAWLFINGIDYIALSLIGVLLPQYQATVFNYSQPVLAGELILMLWLLIKGARAPAAQIRMQPANSAAVV